MKNTGRDLFKLAQYRRCNERDSLAGIGGSCVLCSAGIPGGNYLAADRHEILPKSRLPGVDNWQVLFALENIAPGCRLHHDQLQHLPLVWMKAMLKLGLAKVERYRVPPFADLWTEEDYPPTADCLGHYGYGSKFFQTNEIPTSLRRLYEIRNSGFNPSYFCGFCPARVTCKKDSTGGDGSNR